ncbi:tripartite tricarboxylate transporter permease [Motiliproteus sp. MSK22-1]|uniref:tripartite tricarboxylate transporter permease n=1 Tax=Motiliproteus sp. MSK22-1 TaxID=1897630 RepID=UPI000975E9A0|nr:tripartite tricarboxylate transporter permease [Motiliproteus sp. MSK22-1]OMH27552.1 hypothetical protein BGP75_22535 [Motiliproteus sp. MSK22-1]
MLVDILNAAQQAFSFFHLSYLFLGVVLGLMVGIIPGLGGSAGLALTLPFVAGIDPSAAIGMMIGLQAVTATSDTFPSVLVGVPGTASSQATVVDGFAMSKKGRAAEALSAAFTASLIGGLFGAIVLTVTIGFAEPVILAFGLAEQMMLVLLAVALIGSLTGSNVFKGLAAAAMGMLIGTIGSSPTTAIPRFSLDTIYLIEPIKVVLIGLGLFAVPEILSVLRKQERISEGALAGKGWVQGLKAAFANFWLIIRCSSIGSILGALPGLGGSVIDWVAYAHAKQSVKNPETLGTGDVRGVIAPEAANNAKEGGALMPTLLFGIPGSASMALLLGGFILVGIEPGIDMIRNEADTVYLLVWSVALANIFGAAMCFGLAPMIARLTAVRFALLAPILLIIICFAAFQATKDIGDLVIVAVFGVLGAFMKRYGWSRPALLIGFVLASKLEASVYQTITVYGSSVFTKPIVLVLAAIIAFILIKTLTKSSTKSKNSEKPVSTLLWLRSSGQLVFLASFALFAIWTLYSGQQFDQLTGFFPVIASSAVLILLIAMVASHFFIPGNSFWNDDETGSGLMSFSTSNIVFLLFVACVALLGLLASVIITVPIFLVLVARTKLSVAGLISGALLLFLVLLRLTIDVEFPEGMVWALVS